MVVTEPVDAHLSACSLATRLPSVEEGFIFMFNVFLLLSCIFNMHLIND